MSNVPPGSETYREKAVRKFKENPWVPIGCLATMGALVVASVKMRQGKSQDLNYWLRVRVAAQGATIVAVVAGTYTLSVRNTDEHKAQMAAEAEERQEERILRERKEFEDRLKGAEIAHQEEEEAFKPKGKRRGSDNGTSAPPPPAPASSSMGSRTGGGATPVASSMTDAASGSKSGGSWWGWFGGGSSSAGDSSSKSNDSSKKS